MRKLTLISTLIFSTFVFSSTTFAGWTKVARSIDGNTFYVDFERIRKHGGYVYFWYMTDLLKPEDGVLSDKIYVQGDCKLFRYKKLSISGHKEPMGGGTGDSYSPENPGWEYPPPNSSGKTVLKSVCNHICNHIGE